MLIFKENNKHNYKGITFKKNKFNIQCLITLEVSKFKMNFLSKNHKKKYQLQIYSI